MEKVKASYLVENFQYMADNHWKYVAGGAKWGAVDCSGAFTYWYKRAGGYMYHGSNTMWRKYSTEKGKISEMTLVPGMAVYKRKEDGKEPGVYRKDGLGNFYHVGLYVGNGIVVEAKGTKYGVVESKVSTWGYCSKLKNTEYDLAEDGSAVTAAESTTEEITYPTTGKVRTSGGKLNLREEPSLSGKKKIQIPNNESLTVLGLSGSWYNVEYKGIQGYVSKTYVDIT